MHVNLTLKVGEWTTTIPVSPAAAEALWKQIQQGLFACAVTLAHETDAERGKEDFPAVELPTLYVVNRWGVAVACVDELDAAAQTTRRDQLYPFNAPHVVRRMVDANPQEGS